MNNNIHLDVNVNACDNNMIVQLTDEEEIMLRTKALSRMTFDTFLKRFQILNQ